jgi:hypothetical protein
VRDRVAAAAAHAEHLDNGALTIRVHQFKHSSSPYSCISTLSVIDHSALNQKFP